jgi:hypothetical protein
MLASLSAHHRDYVIDNWLPHIGTAQYLAQVGAIEGEVELGIGPRS